MSKILVTGATGFIGRALMVELDRRGYRDLVTLGRSSLPGFSFFPADLASSTDFSIALDGVETIIHLGGMSSVSPGQENEAHDVNCDATTHLARQAALAGVKRFIFISSAKVLGEASLPGQCLSEGDDLRPLDAYARSKAAAEQGLISIAAHSSMHISILRPPLVYGARAQGNVRALLSLAASSLPLPLGAASAPRSMLYVGNLVDCIIHCLSVQIPSGQVFHVTDGQSTSVAELIRSVRSSRGRRSFLVPVPAAVMLFLLKLLGKSRMAEQLFCPLVLCDEHSRESLSWVPPFSTAEGLSATMKGILGEPIA